MKLLIVSDSHGDWRTLERLVRREKPDQVLHLGDLLGDAQKLSLACPDTPVEAVPGNCDGWFVKGDTARILSYEGVRFFLTHGHAYGVKSGLAQLIKAGQSAGADVILFGHTHRAMRDRWPDGAWVVNPGTAGGVHAQATYAVAQVREGIVELEIRNVDGEQPCRPGRSGGL